MGIIDFFHPKTLEEAKILVGMYGCTKVLAGGTDLVLNIKRGEVACDYVISLENIKELKVIVDEGETIRIGAMATFNDLNNSEVINTYFNSLINCSSTMGSPQIRNVATIGGNIINAGSAADAVPCVMALEGILVMESREGTRRVSCEEYFSNYSEAKIKKDEILTAVIIPKTKGLSGYYKLGKRNSLAIARVSSAVTIAVEDNKVKEARICLGAVGRHPFRAQELEKVSLDKEAHWLFSEEAMNYLSATVEKSIGGRKTMPFKREAIKGVFKEALRAAFVGEETVKEACGERG